MFVIPDVKTHNLEILLPSVNYWQIHQQYDQLFNIDYLFQHSPVSPTILRIFR